MLRSEFKKVLAGTPGRLVRFASPATAEEALRLAVMVSQAEIQETRDSVLYLDTEVADITPVGRLREPSGQHTAARRSADSTAQLRKRGQTSQRRPSGKAGTGSA
jgi:hypothetical protein